jgi:ATP-dependent DNA ligase
MRLPLELPITPMLAKSVPTVPVADDARWSYEPKWDGFRCIVLRDGAEIELASRGSKPLTRYFPELVEALRRLVPERCAVDGEIVVRTGEPGRERLNWEALSQRIHPAESRVRLLSVQTPAEFVAFDLLAVGDDNLTGMPFSHRRTQLEQALAHLSHGDPCTSPESRQTQRKPRSGSSVSRARAWTVSSRKGATRHTRRASAPCSR